MMTNNRPLLTITPAEMKGINRSAVLEVIRSQGNISRTAVADQLKLSLPTVMRIVNDLTAEGLVRLSGTKEWSGGRKRPLIEFNGSEHLVIGIDLGGTKIFGAVTDLSGAMMHEVEIAHHDTQGEDSFSLVLSLVQELLRFASQTGKHVLGIGIGVPGITHPETGVVVNAPSLNWDHFPLKARLMERLPLPVVIENDVNLAALGELWFGGRQDINNLVLIAIGTGIGAGVIINGMVVAGANAMAGEIGYFLPDRSHLGVAYPGFGALEQFASGTGIAERARRLLEPDGSPEKLAALTAEDVFQAARLNEPWALKIVSETVDYLALAISAIALFFDPDIILLGGGVSRSADLLIDPILSRMKGALPALPRLEASTLGYRAAIAGTIVTLLRTTLNYYWLHKFS
jgi:glucokinase